LCVILLLLRAANFPSSTRGDVIHAGGFLDSDLGNAFCLHASVPLLKCHESVGSEPTICWKEDVLSGSPFFKQLDGLAWQKK
jgi:hypothetical protein